MTELEGTVLGVVWARQPCTPYSVRREFTDSPSPYWSGSAGAIYPIMARLQASGLVRSVAHATGERPSRLYRLTPPGRRALARWVGPPLPDIVVGVPPDPLRMRIACLSALPEKRRRALAQEMESRVSALLANSQRALRDGKAGRSDFDLMARGAIAMQKTRLAWVRMVRRTLDRSPRRRR